MILTIIIITLFLAGFAVAVAMQPGEFRVSRSTVIKAPIGSIFPHVNDLHKWEAWSPWAKLDPHAKTTFEGTEKGVGALMRWEGNREVGVGSMEIIESRADEFIKTRLIFLKPMAGLSHGEFAFEPVSGGTRVTWSMTGKNNLAGKAVGLVMNCDKMVGGNFEQGLANLKELAEN
jgi:hypothetical protein